MCSYPTGSGCKEKSVLLRPSYLTNVHWFLLWMADNGRFCIFTFWRGPSKVCWWSVCTHGVNSRAYHAATEVWHWALWYTWRRGACNRCHYPYKRWPMVQTSTAKLLHQLNLGKVSVNAQVYSLGLTTLIMVTLWATLLRLWYTTNIGNNSAGGHYLPTHSIEHQMSTL